ncbi:LuxR C-terminal-related transcriptional regulator [Flexivirga sp. B27]
MGTARFSPPYVDRLRAADRWLRASERDAHAARYAVCRTTISALARVDSFYIGFFRAEDTVFIPYIYDHDQFLRPSIGRYSKHGVSHWVRASKRPYVYAEDGGRLLTNAMPFGNTDEVSLDAVVVPLADAVTGEVTGVMSAQSLEPRAYDDEAVRALEWLGRALMHSFARDTAAQDVLDLYTIYPELDTTGVQDETDLIDAVSSRVNRLHRGIRDLAQLTSHAGGAVAEAAQQLQHLSETTQIEIGELFGELADAHQDDADRPDPAAELTTREREIAELIARDGVSNSDLARQLHISEKTVKTHVGNVLRKLGVAQRAGIELVLSQTVGQPMRHVTRRSSS